MDEKQKPVCGLCQRHQKLETVDGMAFWIEWDENGRPRLCMDSTTTGGGLNQEAGKRAGTGKPGGGRPCDLFVLHGGAE